MAVSKNNLQRAGPISGIRCIKYLRGRMSGSNDAAAQYVSSKKFQVSNSNFKTTF